MSSRSSSPRLTRLVRGLCALVPASLPLVAPAQSAPASEDTPPNVVFILVDDMGWGDLACYGNPYIKTPNLDRLARQGTLYTDFYVTAPVCSPTRASFMTGRYPISVGLPHIIMRGQQARRYGSSTHLDPAFPTITREFQAAGYRVGHYGKWHLGFTDSPGLPLYGIDEYRTAAGPGEQLPYYGVRTNEARATFRQKSTELIVDESIAFIERHQESPFYLNVWPIVPHSPLLPDEQQLSVYPNLDQPDYIPHRSSRQIYYAAITDLDAHIGRLMDKLDELNLTRRTLVIFTSDNGPEDATINNAGYAASGSSGPFRGRKRSLYDGGIRVPFILSWPGRVPAGQVNHSTVVSALDYYPTLLSLIGRAPSAEAELDGEDLSDVFLGATRQRENPIMWEWRSLIFGEAFHFSPRLALRHHNWKFLMNPDGSRIELYDVSVDRMEMQNLADAHPDLVRDFSARLLAFQQAMPPGPVQPGAGDQQRFWPEISSPSASR
jgi:arylsulfatase A-like enzyme